MQKTKDFYEICLADLKGRPNYSDTWIPILEQYCLIIETLQELETEIKGQPVEVTHTNKASHANKATNPKWRMYLELQKAAANLAKDLQLNPATSPIPTNAKGKGFNLTLTKKSA